ncbi:MAG: hypothetical protein Q9201_005839 [Fulgogasparrea decipioides]
MSYDTPSVDSSPTNHRSSIPPVAGVKRPAPSLLPAFEPFSSPPLPRPAKRIARESSLEWGSKDQKYPTPIPTSSTAALSSSPPAQPPTRRPGIARTLSTLSERAPLSTVPTIELDEDGQPILMGRSSNASHYQLSTNKLVSRVHIRAVYNAADPPAPKTVRVECLGWNGVKIHCEHKVFNLQKNDSFTSETEDADIMIDVHDARVLLQWPKEKGKLATPIDSDSPSTIGADSPRHGLAPQHRSPSHSPLRRRVRLQSPVSPSKAVRAISSNPALVPAPDLARPEPIQVYVDEDARQEEEEASGNTQEGATQSTQIASQPFGSLLGDSQSSALSETQEYSDNDEENEPIVHSFGPFGANLDSRLAAITANESPDRPRPALSPLKASSVSPQRLRRADPPRNQDENVSPVVNHVINQLAYSRLASTPLTTIFNHLPAHFKDNKSGSKENTGLTTMALKQMLDSTACIGEVTREGKDAAGKPLESEFYYIPERDNDVKRRDAVVEGLRKPGLRACRKQHKVRISTHSLLSIQEFLLTSTLLCSNTTGENPNERFNIQSIMAIVTLFLLISYSPMATSV